MLKTLAEDWNFEDISKAYKITGTIPFHEAGLLTLNCAKALFYMHWESNLLYPETIKMVSEWYTAFYRDKADMVNITIQHISEYEQIGVLRKRIWASNIK